MAQGIIDDDLKASDSREESIRIQRFYRKFADMASRTIVNGGDQDRLTF